MTHPRRLTASAHATHAWPLSPPQRSCSSAPCLKHTHPMVSFCHFSFTLFFKAHISTRHHLTACLLRVSAPGRTLRDSRTCLCSGLCSQHMGINLCWVSTIPYVRSQELGGKFGEKESRVTCPFSCSTCPLCSSSWAFSCTMRANTFSRQRFSRDWHFRLNSGSRESEG